MQVYLSDLYETADHTVEHGTQEHGTGYFYAIIL